MKLKILFSISLFCIIAEIIFSFYYSATSLSLSDQYNSIQSQLHQLKITNEQLTVKLAQISSLKNIQTFATDKNLAPIKKHYAF